MCSALECVSSGAARLCTYEGEPPALPKPWLWGFSLCGDSGAAVASYHGSVKSRGGSVSELCVEHRCGLVEAVEELASRLPSGVCAALVLVPVGCRRPGEPLLVVHVAAASRSAAFSALASIVEWYKGGGCFSHVER